MPVEERVSVATFTVARVQDQPEEHQTGRHPLLVGDRVVEKYDGDQNREEFPCGRDDRTGQRTEIGDGQENKILKKRRIQTNRCSRKNSIILNNSAAQRNKHGKFVKNIL